MSAVSNVSLSQTDPISKISQVRAQRIRTQNESAQVEEEKVFDHAKSLLPKIAKLNSEAIDGYNAKYLQSKADYDLRKWVSSDFFVKGWAGLKLAFTSRPTTLPLNLLESSYDYNNYEDTKFYKALQLLEEAGLVTVSLEVHPQQTQGLPNYVPSGLHLTTEGKRHIASLLNRDLDSLKIVGG